MTRQEMKSWRLFRGLRESDVAQMFGFTEAEIKDMESGKTAIPDRIYRQISSKSPKN